MHFRLSVIFFFTALWLGLSAAPLQASDINRAHAIAMHGAPKYPSEFNHFEYASPHAAKGGSVRLHSLGTFDSLNPFIAKGTPAAAVGNIYDTLTVSSADEPFTQYGLLAKTIEYPDDRSWVLFHLDERAHFHDGEPVTANDVKFTFETLVNKGNPFYGFYYADVSEVIVLDEHRVRFNFHPGASHEAALIIGQLPVLPKHFWQERDFEQSSLQTPLGSGPYKISSAEPGRSITLTRVKNYWAKDHPINVGSYNFDEIHYDYYRDDVVALEAFKAGEYDFRLERTAKLWATAYEGDLLSSGRVKKLQLEHENPTGMQAFIFNIRRPVFQDRALRKAMTLAFDFEWANKNLFYGSYTRTESYFSNSELASSGLPSKAELELLLPHRQQLPESVFTEAYELPVSSGSDRNRKNLRDAKRILDAAGYRIENGNLLSPVTNRPVEFEILLYNPSFERVANPFVQGLKKLGIQAKLRMVDASQFINRRRSFDFDMAIHSFAQSLSPGNEQRDFWHSESAQVEGSRNLIGIENPVVDQLVDEVIRAKTRAELITACRALDRVLLNEYYTIPQWHIKYHRIAYWDRFERPSISPIYDPLYSTGFMTWWLKPEQRAEKH